MIREGIYNDIAAYPGVGVVHATLGSDWRTVTVDHVTPAGRTTLWSVTMPSPCLYIRVAVSPSGTVLVVGQDGREGTSRHGAVWIVTRDRQTSIDGYGFGQAGVIAEWAPDLNAFRVYGARWDVDYGSGVVSETGEVSPWHHHESPVPETTQGWLDVVDGQLVWTDLARHWGSGAEQLVCPHSREGVTVGQVPQGNGLRVYGAGIASELTNAPVYEPRVAFDRSSGLFAVAARLANFQTFFTWCPPWPSIEAPAPPVIDPVNRAIWFGFYEFAGDTDCPVNCRLKVVQDVPWLVVRDLAGRDLYRYVSGHPDGDPDAIDHAVATGRAVGDGLEVLAYVPRGASAVRLPDAVIGVECYRRLDESVAAFEQHIRSVVARCSRVVLIAQCYTSNHTQSTDLRSIPPVIERITRYYANVEGILVFSGSGRPTGFQEHPEVQDDWRRVSATIAVPHSAAPPSPHPEVPVSPAPAVPDYSHIVREVYDAGGHTLKTHEGCGRFLEAVVARLHPIDPRVVHLKKRGAQNQFNGHGLDAFLYLHDAPHLSQSVDVITNSDDPNTAAVGWSVDIPRYTREDAIDPSVIGTPDAPGAPAPPPAPGPAPQPPAPPLEPAPPGKGHPILDADIRDFDTRYRLYIHEGRETDRLAREWYERANGHGPAEEDIKHGYVWRLLVEPERWKTLREAWKDAWPGGEPKGD